MIDCHTHFWKATHWSREMAEEAAIARGEPAKTDVEEAEHWQAMAPVDKAIVFGFRATQLGLVVPNDVVSRYVASHTDKLIGFACVDPCEHDCLDELRRSVEELGMRGLKLAPIYQNIHPMDERVQPLYDYCQRNRLPIMFHQGTTFPRRAPLKYASPIQLEDVALKYPDLRMVIAHMGHPWLAETVALIRKQPHIYADISALHYRPWQFYNGLMLAVEYGTAHKLLLGSDYPFTTPSETLAGLRGVNRVVGESGLPRVPDAVIERILGRDTLQLLGLA